MRDPLTGEQGKKITADDRDWGALSVFSDAVQMLLTTQLRVTGSKLRDLFA